MKFAPLITLLLVSIARSQDISDSSFGWSVAGLGDVDGDGRSDIAVGRTFDVIVYSSATWKPLWRTGCVEVIDHFGYALARAGDWNGDGAGDLVASAPAGIRLAASFRVLSGVDGKTLATAASNVVGDEFGHSIAAGDLDGDGLAEIVVGAPKDATAGVSGGAAYVYSGAMPSVRHVVRGEAANDELGASVAIVGDLDGDHVGEALIGAPHAQQHGQVLIVSGRTGRILRTLAASAGDDRFGISLCSFPSVDGDAVEDFAVGVGVAHGTGLVRLFSGATGEVLREIRSASVRSRDEDRFAFAIAAVHSDFDGYAELVVGAPNEWYGGSNYGFGHLFSARDGSQRAFVGWDGDTVQHGLGTSVANAGDVDGDGSDDVVFGAPDNLLGGGVHVYSLRQRGTIVEFTATDVTRRSTSK